MNWLTDWDQAARYPWRTRAFLFIAFTALTFLVALLVGATRKDVASIAVDALAVGAIAALLLDPRRIVARRTRDRQHGEAEHARTTGIGVAAIFTAGTVLAAVMSAIAGALLILLGVVALLAWRASA
jgi:hypothetical protein